MVLGEGWSLTDLLELECYVKSGAMVSQILLFILLRKI